MADMPVWTAGSPTVHTRLAPCPVPLRTHFFLSSLAGVISIFAGWF